MGNCIGGARGARPEPARTFGSVASAPNDPSPAASRRSESSGSPLGSRAASPASPELGGLSPLPRSPSAASTASPGRISISSLESLSGPASPGKQRLREFVSLLTDLQTTRTSTDHPAVKALDAELQSKLMEAQNKVSDSDHEQFRSALLGTPDGGVAGPSSTPKPCRIRCSADP